MPIGPTILITQNGLRSLPVWNDWYIFTGVSNSAGWLLDKRSNTTNRFQSGYVLTGKNPVYNLNVTLQSYQATPSIRPRERWAAYTHNNRIFFEGNQHSDNLIIALTDRANEGMITTLAQQTHFHMKICETANELDPHQHCLKRLGHSESHNNIRHNDCHVLSDILIASKTKGSGKLKRTRPTARCSNPMVRIVNIKLSFIIHL